jgi:pimeloyl-ACP methyl ester carboxylesterase
MRRKAALFPQDFSLEPLGRIWTVRQFDEAYTAPYYGFADATDYYHRASAMRAIDRIRVPTLILTAENDPFVPPEPFRDAAVAGNVGAVGQFHGFHAAVVAAQLHVDDLAVGAHHATLLGEPAQIGGIQGGIELECVAEGRHDVVLALGGQGETVLARSNDRQRVLLDGQRHGPTLTLVW